MKDREIFKNNKIREALCQFTFQESFDNTIYGEFWSKLNDSKDCNYCKKENISSFQFSVQGGTGSIVPNMVNAMKFSNEEGDKVIQLFHNNLSIHNIGNYKQWEVFEEDIDATIEIFQENYNEIKINRVDLRAINEFEFDAGIEIEDYFKIHPSIDKDVPFNTPDIDMRLNEKLDDKGNFISMTIQKQVTGENVLVVVDISYTGIFETPVQITEYKTVKDRMEYGHSQLNSVFYNLITDKTREILN